MGDFGSSFAATFGAMAQSYQTQQMLQLEQQKQNIEGYQQFYNMLQTMDPATLKAMKPTIMQNFFGVDPKDKAVGAFFDQAIDGNTQIGKSIRDAFSSLSSNDPNNPVMKMMMKMPIQNFAAMGRDPSKMASFLSSITAINQQTQGIGLMTKLVNGDQTTPPVPAGRSVTPAPSAPATSTTTATTAPQAAPQAAGSQGQTYTGGDLNTAVTTTSENEQNIKNFVQPAAASPRATAPAPSAPTQPAAAAQPTPPVAAGTSIPGMPAALSAKIADLRHKAQLLSMYSVSKNLGDKFQAEADKLESDYVAGSNAVAQTRRAAAQESEAATAAGTLALKRQSETYAGTVSPDEQNKAGLMPGATYQKNQLGKYSQVQPDPNAASYATQRNDIIAGQTIAQKALPVLRTIKAGLTSNEPSAVGPVLEPRIFMSQVLTALGHGDFATHFFGKAATSDTVEAGRHQFTTIVSAAMRKNFGSGAAQLENVENNIGEMTDSRQGQIAIVNGLIAAQSRANAAGDILRQHEQKFGRAWTRETNGKLDPNGQDAFAKVNSYMSSTNGVPQSVLDAISANTGTIAQPQPGAQAQPSPGQPAPASAFKILGTE